MKFLDINLVYNSNKSTN